MRYRAECTVVPVPRALHQLITVAEGRHKADCDSGTRVHCNYGTKNALCVRLSEYMKNPVKVQRLPKPFAANCPVPAGSRGVYPGNVQPQRKAYKRQCLFQDIASLPAST